jgi:hypothetical protein
MSTFWMGAALAADYGQDTVHSLGVATRPHGVVSQSERLARRHAFDALNRAIGRAVQAQLDDQLVVRANCLMDDGDDDDSLMHCGGMECYFCTFPDKSVVVRCVSSLR